MTKEKLIAAFELSDKIESYKQVRENLHGEHENIEYAVGLLRRRGKEYDDEDMKELQTYISEASAKIKVYVDLVIERTQKQFDEL